MKISQEWVVKLLTELNSKSGVSLAVAESLPSPTAIFSYEPAPRIWIYEKKRGQETVFSFETDARVPVFKCDLKKYPNLVRLVKKYYPKKEFKLIDPWKVKREKDEEIKKLEKQKKKLFNLHQKVVKAHDDIVDQISKLSE